MNRERKKDLFSSKVLSVKVEDGVIELWAKTGSGTRIYVLTPEVARQLIAALEDAALRLDGDSDDAAGGMEE